MPGRTVKAGDEGVRVFRVVVNSRAGCVRSSVGGDVNPQRCVAVAVVQGRAIWIRSVAGWAVRFLVPGDLVGHPLR